MLEKIISFVSEQLSVNESEIDEKTEIVDDLGADSLDVVEILMRVEKEFNVPILDGDITTLKTVGDVAKYVEAHA